MPFSTLGWENPDVRSEGYATGAAKGLKNANLHDHSYWESGSRADWVSEMREQIRLWFYSQHFMSVSSPAGAVPAGAQLREDARRKRPRDAQVVGNAIEAGEAFERMGADVMRWQYCAQPPNQNLLFGFGPGREIQRELLTLWNSVEFFVDYANIDAIQLRLERAAPGENCDPRPVADRPNQCACRRGGDRRLPASSPST